MLKMSERIGAIACIVLRLVKVVFKDLSYEVRVLSIRKLLEAHVNVWVHHFEVFVLFTSKETIVPTLVLYAVARSLSQLLI